MKLSLQGELVETLDDLRIFNGDDLTNYKFSCL